MLALWRSLAPWRLTGLLILAGVLAYHNSLTGAFVMDDIPNILQGPVVRGDESLLAQVRAEKRPLLLASLRLNYLLGETDPRGYHVFNIAIHLLAGLALFGLVRRTHSLPRQVHRFGQASGYLAFAVALLWIVHPLQTESVTYIVQRCESLMGLCQLACLYALARSGQSQRAWLWYAAAVASCYLGMAAKQTMVTAPLAMLLYDRAFLADTFRAALRRRWLLYALLLPPMVWVSKDPLTPLLQDWSHSTTATQSTATSAAESTISAARDTPPAAFATHFGFAFKGVTRWEYLRSQPGVLLHYLRLAAWPDRLSLYHDWPVSREPLAIAINSLIIAALVAAGLWAWQWRPTLGFVGTAFFLSLAPRSIMPSRELAVEHRMYLPLACVLTLVVVLGWQVAVAIGARRGWSARRLACWQGALLLMATGGLISRTVIRNADYHSEIAIWQSATRANGENRTAHYNLGVALLHDQRPAEAIREFQRTCQIDPNYMPAYANAGAAYLQQGEFDLAVEHFQKAAELEPAALANHVNLAGIYLRRGHWAQAEVHYRAALAIDARLPTVHADLGSSLLAQERLPEAQAAFEQSLRCDPQYAAAHRHLGTCLYRQADLAGAIAALRRAVAIDERDADAWHELGNAFALQRETTAAEQAYEQSAALRPDNAALHLDWGNFCAHTKRPQQAAEHFAATVRLDPVDARARVNLAAMLVELGRPRQAAHEFRTALANLQPDSHIAAQIRAWLDENQ